ncbi:MAG: molybdopterin-dependent oxidoreductase [Bryobacteraceae bacterium]
MTSVLSLFCMEDTPIFTRRAACFLASGLCLVGLFGRVAAAQSPEVLLRVQGDVKTPLSLTAEDLAAMPRHTAVQQSDGKDVTYEGVLLYDILKKAGVPFGQALMGKGMASYVLAGASDGYQVVFAIAEVDPEIEGSAVLVADKRDGGPLNAKQKPLQVIAPQDKRHARSIHSLITLDVVMLRK